MEQYTPVLWYRVNHQSRYGTVSRKPTDVHLGETDPSGVADGNFPLACGRWAPNGVDADIVVASSNGWLCKQCKAIQDESAEAK